MVADVTKDGVEQGPSDRPAQYLLFTNWYKRLHKSAGSRDAKKYEYGVPSVWLLKSPRMV